MNDIEELAKPEPKDGSLLQGGLAGAIFGGLTVVAVVVILGAVAMVAQALGWELR